MTSLQHLFSVFFRIGCLSFGGPAAQIALMQTECVDRHKLIEQDAFLRALSFCMLLPGPEAMQLATYIGWQRAGVVGGLLAGLLFVLPGAVVIALLATIYAILGNVPFVEGAFVGIQAIVVLIIVQALWRLARKALNGPRAIALALAAFAALYLFSLPFPILIGAALFIGALAFPRPHLRQTPARARPIGRAPFVFAFVWLVPLIGLLVLRPGFYADVAQLFSQLAVVSFGGAYAVLTYMTQTVVQDYGWISADQMIDALGLAETTPGPLILVTQFVAMIAGYGQSGIGSAFLAGTIALWMTFVPCFLWIFLFGPFLERLLAVPWLAAALSAVSAAIVGVIANLSIWFAMHVYFAQTDLVVFGPVSVVLPVFSSFSLFPVLIAIGAAVPLWRGWVPLPILLALAAFVGALAHGMLG